jgi:hypothetical protein
MSRRPPHRRRRPGRRPPSRYSGKNAHARPNGFTGSGFRQLHQGILPGLKGAAKKSYFNELSRGIIVVAGICGAVFGLVGFGWLGAILGLGGAIAAAGSFVQSGRFYRD